MISLIASSVLSSPMARCTVRSRFDREILILGLGFLETKDIRLFSIQPVQDDQQTGTA